MSNPAINPQHLTNLANLNLDLAQNHTPLEKFYKWAKDNIVQAVQKEVKREHGLDLRKKLDKLKFAQEIAKKELEKLGGQLMFIPNKFISQVKDLLGKGNGKEIGEDQVRLSVLKEILELEQKIEELEDSGGILREYCFVDGETNDGKEGDPKKLSDKILLEDDDQPFYTLWDRQTDLVYPICQILGKYDQTYRYQKRLYGSDEFAAKSKEMFLERLFDLGLIYNDLETEVASSEEVDNHKQDLLIFSMGEWLYEASQLNRWDLVAGLLREQKETPNVKTFWKTYFLQKRRNQNLQIEEELEMNLEFIRDCPELEGLCDLVDLVKNLEGQYHCNVVNFLNYLLRGGKFPDYRMEQIEDFNDWLEYTKLELGEEYLKEIFIEQLHSSLYEIDFYLKQKIYTHQKNQEYMDSLFRL